jgi:putative oxidoreductase
MTNSQSTKPSLNNILMIVCQVLLGGIMLSGGIMHFTNDPIVTYQNDFLTAIFKTGYLWEFMGVIEAVCGIAILARRYMPIALIVLAPISLMILTFHISELGKVVVKPGGIYIGVMVALTHAFLAWNYRSYFKSLFEFKARVG